MAKRQKKIALPKPKKTGRYTVMCDCGRPAIVRYRVKQYRPDLESVLINDLDLCWLCYQLELELQDKQRKGR